MSSPITGQFDYHDGHVFDASSYRNPSASTPPVASATTEQPSALVTAIGGDADATGTLTDANGVVSDTSKIWETSRSHPTMRYLKRPGPPPHPAVQAPTPIRSLQLRAPISWWNLHLTVPLRLEIQSLRCRQRDIWLLT